jgi:predicted MFS family arabinose efflux permease
MTRSDPVFRIALLALGPAVALGIGRFAYALLLPDMQRDLGWDYGQAGWLNTVNAAGYLIGALGTAALIRRVGLARLFAGSALVCALTVGLMGAVEGMAGLSALRFAAGLAGAFVFVAGGVAAAGLAQGASRRAGLIIGLYYGGPGLGIALSGGLLPFFMADETLGGWPVAWGLLGAISLALALLAALARPGASSNGAAIPKADPPNDRPFQARACLPILAGYTLFGAGYIGYMTFMFAHLEALGLSVAGLALFWTVIGAAAMASPFLWARLIGGVGHGWAFAILTATTGLGAWLPLLSGDFAMVLVSAAIFGSAFFAVVASTTAFVRRNTAPSRHGTAIGIFTACFGAGQVLGPVAVGVVSDLSGGLETGLFWSCVLLAAAAATGALQRDLRRAVSA